jgi:hypothetical protein
MQRIWKSYDEIKEIHREWIMLVLSIFEKYKNSFERTYIPIPLYYCKYLASIGLIDYKKIDHSKEKIQIVFGKARKIQNDCNVDLIYKCFDEIIQNGQVLENILV